MTKAEIAANVSRTTNIDKTAVIAVIESFMDEVKESLSRGEKVCLRGFGTFERRTRRARTCRDIGRGTAVDVPEHDIPAFKPAEDFRKMML